MNRPACLKLFLMKFLPPVWINVISSSKAGFLLKPLFWLTTILKEKRKTLDPHAVLFVVHVIRISLYLIVVHFVLNSGVYYLLFIRDSIFSQGFMFLMPHRITILLRRRDAGKKNNWRPLQIDQLRERWFLLYVTKITDGALEAKLV